MEMLLPLGAFLLATAVVAFAGMRLVTNRGTVIDRRLQEVTESYGRDVSAPRQSQVKDMLKRLGERMPQSTVTTSFMPCALSVSSASLLSP